MFSKRSSDTFHGIGTLLHIVVECLLVTRKILIGLLSWYDHHMKHTWAQTAFYSLSHSTTTRLFGRLYYSCYSYYPLQTRCTHLLREIHCRLPFVWVLPFATKSHIQGMRNGPNSRLFLKKMKAMTISWNLIFLPDAKIFPPLLLLKIQPLCFRGMQRKPAKQK